MEHYFFCPSLPGLARRHLRLDPAVVREVGVGALIRRVGVASDRGLWVAFHIDVSLMAFNSIRHDRGGDGHMAYPRRLKNLARRALAVERFLRQCARDRASAEATAAVLCRP